jgi:hypothetical protein
MKYAVYVVLVEDTGELMSNGDAPPRIFKVRYRSLHNGRCATVFVKVPYSGTYGMTEMLTRQQTKRQVMWFRVDVASAKDIAEHRSELARWPDALRASSLITRVDWAA